MSLRPASLDDAPALGTILSDWIDETVWMPRLHSRAEDRGFVEGLIRDAEVWTDETRSGFVARSGEEVPALYLAPGARGRGLGAELLNAARTRRESLGLWTFQANSRAVAFYLREGFTEAHRTEGDNAEGLPDIRLIWRRAP
ncbi:GNAT family N-acetyltransferase [Ponticoccus sp. SC2-23]|uniref:GNAT family N-acetyltransferase n=1 Tax=Alexandriicola marinus TaxID=2081710 RepID=UPI000FDAD8F7|nr:GNAT family N-acetyltransferase [Alexandriicola marinus]MBM1221510.1 GNAT family N-acetyltransferase [Ponticoccus sp. SC6-9]MBM1226551.1 GNAT family N-acetyltransferase [Ponticoccus sp. SC6-15]MBM1230502.1 GNAT family N-acetyltransferase [Ponticoccus sp. SC6-38]MBM1235025.1 GNAT family N-acetyltransferase [Ponticoccus sp. SC6-45]MBM1239523.1 GNAT family N-acetyltransferase [Ponticoccus sp. SC6-49]MBM1243305.1 GNAT family N-acetyltransferase [Ponticoccus sp. SC2-64]MBM1248549.1 GNAT family